MSTEEMLQKMGWKQGDGLGIANQGETAPVSDGLAVQKDRLGAIEGRLIDVICWCFVSIKLRVQ